ncbi:type II toxin-antitoxin system HicA family toxin [Candidatus Gottesmanbacteria bacterium]|nr:type II toxin-antitoxin system HicA family toxin [Candidatus Gottesmanbacteria bacterium]
MPKLPLVSGKDLVKAFKKLGFIFVSQRGSHIKMRHPDGRTVIIPNHKIIKKGTLKKGVLNPLNISVEEFSKLLS